MHEMSIAIALQEQVEAALHDQPGARVRQIELEIGAMQMVVPEALEAAWTAAVNGTELEGSVLIMKEINVIGECRSCGEKFSPTLRDFACPECFQADVEIRQGRDIILRAIHCDVPNDEEK